MINEEIISLAKLLWNYHQMNQKPEKADCILALGSHDLRVPERVAELYLQGFAPLIIMSGGLGNFTQEIWTEKEADKFAAIAIEKGVPEESILIENNSTNTGENILFTQKLLQGKRLYPHSFIVVQKPYMERRTYATFQKQWPGKTVYVTSPQISFEEYPTADILMEKVINIMVGDLQRIRLYAEKGFQNHQIIPEPVWNAYKQLVEAGFDKQLVKH